MCSMDIKIEAHFGPKNLWHRFKLHDTIFPYDLGPPVANLMYTYTLSSFP
jgi:hypothetical protein